MTPVETGGMSLSVQQGDPEIGTDLTRPDRPSSGNFSPVVEVEISTRLGALSGCALVGSDLPTECGLQDGALTIRMGKDGEPTMVATIDRVDGEALAGRVRLEAPVLPGGGIEFGTARMVRKG